LKDWIFVIVKGKVLLNMCFSQSAIKMVHAGVAFEASPGNACIGLILAKCGRHHEENF